MLRRLIRYDMRAISKIAVPIFIASGIISLLCCSVLYFTFGFADHINSSFKAFMITGGLYLIGLIAIFGMLAIVVFAIISRYYSSVFGDEGYLNMVIPVSRKNLLNSKIISSVIWFLLAGAVAWVCVVVSLILPTLLYDMTLVSELVKAVMSEMGIEKNGVAFGITTVLVKLLISAADAIKDVVVIITAITLGASVVKQFKIAFSVLLYFVIVFLEELFVDFVELLVHEIAVNHSWLALVFDSVFELVVIAAVFVIAYSVTLYALEKRFNID